MGELIETDDEEEGLFDSYHCMEHIDGTGNEVIDDLLFLYQYYAIIGSLGTQEIINRRFY